MAWWKNIAKFAGPVVGAALGSIGGGELGIDPSIGGAIGGALGGFGGGELGGAGTGGSLLDAGLGAAGGYLAGPTVAGWAGATPGPSSAVGAGLPGSNSSLDDILKQMGTGSAAEASIPAIDVGAATPTVADAVTSAATPAASSATAGGLESFLAKNPILTTLGIGAAGTVLSPTLSNLVTPTDPAEAQLQKQAKELASVGQAGLNGQLTPAATVALNDAITTIKSQYANLGMSGSTSEAQDIAAAQERAVAQSAQEGVSDLGLSENLYAGILGYNQKNDEQLSQSISSMLQSIGYASGSQGKSNNTAAA